MKTITTFQGQPVQQVSNGQARMLIAPQYGGRLLTWSIGDDTVLYWPETTEWDQVAHVRGGNPILFPFVARHMVDGVIGRWRDAAGVVRELPMHGFARDMPYAVLGDTPDETLHMRIVSDDATRAMYPFDFQFDVIYRLLPDALEVTLETVNTGDAALPYYPGHHFYFAVPHADRPSWHLSLPCERWGWQNPDGSVRFAPATQTDFTLDDSTLIDRFQLDFTSDCIALKGAGRDLTIELAGPTATPHGVDWYDVTTWTQTPASDFFCVEPWLGLPNAIHHGYGLRWLAPGHREAALCRITARRN